MSGAYFVQTREIPVDELLRMRETARADIARLQLRLDAINAEIAKRVSASPVRVGEGP